MLRHSAPLELALAGAAGLFLLLAAPPWTPLAHAQDDWGDGGWGDEGGGGEDPWGDGGDAGGGDAWGDAAGWGEEEEEEKEQPPVTAGGLYTKRTWPTEELLRTLTLIEGMFEARAGIGIDVSNETAFDNWRGVVEGRYGLRDYLELRLSADFLLAGEALPPLNNQARFVAGFERAIVYDLVDFRAQAELPINPDAPEGVDDVAFDLAFGFPFRYRYEDKIGLIALDKLMTIHTDGRDPDLTIGVGAIGQVAPKFAVVARGEVIVPQFQFDETIRIPATAAAQFSPTNMVDLGLELRLGNLKPEGEDASPLDRRSVLLYVQPRF